jgi:ABC-type multidrug transport system ATPase subunit
MLTIERPPLTVPLSGRAPTPSGVGVRIALHDVGVTRRGTAILEHVSLQVEPGELVAVVGASGAGKSTLLDAMAGVRPATSGTILVDGTPAGDPSLRHTVGYVPQDDLIHRDLPLAATLRYAARLRLPRGTTPAEIEATVADTLARLGLTERAGTRVGDLSGGQRKRTSIAVELLTRPRAFFLDEPTSGLDPATAANLMATLRELADEGTTIVLTTHNLDDLQACDRTVEVAGGATFAGPPAEPRGNGRAEAPQHSSPAVSGRDARPAARGPGGLAQWRALTRRNVEILRRNRLTLAIMLGAPALVIAMFTMLFRGGALAADHPDATAAVSTGYWIVFAAFFFGLTYGLLQIVTELAIVRREVFVGVRLVPYLAAKVAVLVPVLVAVDVAMLAVLRGLDRLPPLDTATYGRLAVTLFATSLAAVSLGLLASAAVADPAQATLALPMLCFPAVLFAGAVLPVATMDVGGRAMSYSAVTRWGFEAVGHDLGLSGLLAGDRTGTGPALLSQYGSAFNGTSTGDWLLLAAFAAAFLAGTATVIRRRTTP